MNFLVWRKYAIFGVSLCITACGIWYQPIPVSTTDPVQQSLSFASLQRFTQTSRVLIQNQPYDIAVHILPEQPSTGQLTNIAISVEQNGVPIDLEAAGRLMQVTLVSQNMLDFQHFLLETPSVDGQYIIDYVLKQPGQYALWIDINHNNIPNHHGDNTDYRSVTFFNATGATVEGYDQLAEPSFAAIYDGYTFAIKPEALYTDKIHILEITANDAAGKSASFVLNDPFYVLASPSTENYDLNHMHTGTSTNTTLTTQEVAFLEPGIYALWTFLYIEEADGRVRVVNPRFLLKVQKKPEAVSASSVAQ